jgi:hypothetical protein
VFRQETMAIDLVPQMMRAPFTDRWAARMVQVGDWRKMVGDEAQASSIYRDLLALVPDQAEAKSRLRR